MGIKDFWRKVRILLEGEPEDGEYTSDRDEYEEDERPYSRGSESARLAERMAQQYEPDDDEDEDEEPTRVYSRGSYDDRGFRRNDGYGDDSYDDRGFRRNDGYGQYDEPDDEYDDVDAGTDDYDDSYSVSSRAYKEEDDEPLQAQPEEPLPSRTEVILREIKRLSDRLDPDTLRQYQMELVKVKKSTGAVSALTALRILHQYVEDDDDGTQVDRSNLPDLSAK